MLLASTVAPALAGDDYPQTYEVLRDARGNHVGTILCDGITPQCLSYDTKGRRTGTIVQEPVRDQPREPDLGEDHGPGLAISPAH